MTPRPTIDDNNASASTGDRSVLTTATTQSSLVSDRSNASKIGLQGSIADGDSTASNDDCNNDESEKLISGGTKIIKSEPGSN